jgi:hypothetical protein
MAPRLTLHQLLKTFGAEEVYFQPPSADKMKYPCIVYELDDVDSSHADNTPYTSTDRYQLTVIDRNPDTLIRKKVGKLPMCSFQRFFVVDGLNHFVYDLYF